MTTFDSTKSALSKLLEQVSEGKIQLPDFQRGWIWDDAHIRSLLVSIARSFPIGSIMLLETGGSAKFQIRPVEGITPSIKDKIEKLRWHFLVIHHRHRRFSLRQLRRINFLSGIIYRRIFEDGIQALNSADADLTILRNK